MTKIRTQIQLERRQYERLKRLAYERRQSLSAVVRELLDQGLETDFGRVGERDIRLAFVGTGRDPKPDVARKHDSYLYEGPS